MSVLKTAVSTAVLKVVVWPSADVLVGVTVASSADDTLLTDIAILAIVQ